MHTCPNCGSELVKRNGAYGEFWGCSNYPDCTYTKNIIDDDYSYGECPECGSPLRLIESINGDFLGCTDYPDCNVDIVDLAQILCDENKCYEGINNKPLYEDQNHLNQEGSNLVAPKIIQKIDKMLAN